MSQVRETSGADDAGLVALALANGSLCVQCIAHKTGILPGRVEAILVTIAEHLKVNGGPGRCDACLGRGTTFRVQEQPEG